MSWSLMASVRRFVSRWRDRDNLTEASCRGTDFSGARFDGTNLTKTDLRDALNYALRPCDNILKGARFSLPEATGSSTVSGSGSGVIS